MSTNVQIELPMLLVQACGSFCQCSDRLTDELTLENGHVQTIRITRLFFIRFNEAKHVLIKDAKRFFDIEDVIANGCYENKIIGHSCCDRGTPTELVLDQYYGGRRLAYESVR